MIPKLLDLSKKEVSTTTRYKGPIDLLLHLGTFYHRLPGPTPEYVKKFKTHCYKISCKTVFKHKDYTYVEGYAFSKRKNKVIFIRHGWLLDIKGNIYDKTFRGYKGETVYLGIKLPIPVLRQSLSSSGYYGVLGGKYREWPKVEKLLLKHGVTK